MTNEATRNKLIEMRLSAMANAFDAQRDDPNMSSISFDDRFGLLVDIEYCQRKNNALHRLVKRAGLEQKGANINEIDYSSGRKLNRDLIARLASCEFVREGRNIFITGATGSGKTFPLGVCGLEQGHDCSQLLSGDFRHQVSEEVDRAALPLGIGKDLRSRFKEAQVFVGRKQPYSFRFLHSTNGRFYDNLFHNLKIRIRNQEKD